MSKELRIKPEIIKDGMYLSQTGKYLTKEQLEDAFREEFGQKAIPEFPTQQEITALRNRLLALVNEFEKKFPEAYITVIHEGKEEMVTTAWKRL